MTKYLFVDAACLRARLERFVELYSPGAVIDLNWDSFSAGFNKVFYYDALPVQKNITGDEDFEGRRRVAEQLQIRLQILDRFRVYQGDARWRKGRGTEQKKVDVMITVDMLKHTIRRNMDETTLLAGDADFVPLLNALVDEGMFVTLLYPPKATSDELLHAADARKPLSYNRIWGWLDAVSQTKFQFVSRVAIESRRQGELLQEWDDPNVGRVEFRRRADHEGGSHLAKFVLQWNQSPTDQWDTLQGASAEILTQVADDEHNIQRPTSEIVA